ncbi:MAG: VOC family protein [Steroidobacteraceae bacterium]|nr:VOC family protein [Steroidobacteraceae bacterium]
MRLDHIGVWVRDLDAVAAFYARYFDARVGDLYENPRKGFRSRFLIIGEGARLELMTRTDVTAVSMGETTLGLAHVALIVGDEAAVDALAARLRSEGHAILDGPRRTGDGYYECVVCDR